MKFGETKIANKKFYFAKKPVKTWDARIDNIVISKLVETKSNSKYLIGINFDKAIRPLVLVMHKIRRSVKTFKVKAFVCYFSLFLKENIYIRYFEQRTLKRNLTYNVFSSHCFMNISFELPCTARLLKTSSFEKRTACIIETMLMT